MNFRKIALIGLITIFLAISVLYERLSVNRQLFFFHKIPRGSLSIHPNSIPTILASLKQINSNPIFNITYTFTPNTHTISQFVLNMHGFPVFETIGNNFMALGKSKGEILSHGDSFYQIEEQQEQLCREQVIKNIRISKQNVIQITGHFSDCKQSTHKISIIMHQENKLQLTTKLTPTSAPTPTNPKYNRILLYFPHKKNNNNNYFGLGQQFSYLNLGNDRPYSLFVREKGVARTDQPETFFLNAFYKAGGSYYNSYSPAPIWYSILLDQNKNKKTVQCIGYFLKSWAYAIWMNNHIYVWDTELTLYLFPSNSVKDVIKLISQQNGYTPPVPDWVNEGAIVGLQGGTESVMKKYAELKKAGTAITGLWLQDWVSKRKSLGFSRLWWNWQLDTNHYKNWSQMRQTLQKQNVSLLIYINPMLTDVQNSKPNYTTNYYKKALEQNCFATQKDGSVYMTSAFSDWRAAIFDFGKSEHVGGFYQDILRRAIRETGAQGLMVDFGEAYPVENMDTTLEQSAKNHNKYPTTYHETVHEVLTQFPSHQLYSFSRAGYLYTPRYTLSLWAGDQAMNFKKHSGLPSCLTAMLSSSLIGYSNTHCDIGGYSSYGILGYGVSERGHGLMTRWMQLGAFSAVFRTHEGNRPESSLQVYSDPRIAKQFSFYSRIFLALAAYRKQQAYKSQQQGLPLIRPFFIENQHNAQSYIISDQYYLGQDILVSPILTKKNQRKYYLPQGKWVSLWDKSMGVIEGCDCYRDSGTFLPPVFIKQNSAYLQSIIAKLGKLLDEYRPEISYLQQKPQQL